MRDDDYALIGLLIRRTEWREGEVTDRLRAVEKRAKWRAKTGAYDCDRETERRVAKLAWRVRKALERR